MADDKKKGEEKPEEGKEGKPAASPKQLTTAKLLIIIFAMFLLLGGLGIFVLIKFVAPKINPAPQEQVEEKAEPKKETAEEGGHGGGGEGEKKGEGAVGASMYKVEPFIVNLAESGGKRFLKVSIELEMNSAALKEEIDGRIAQVRDMIITVLSDKSFDDIYSVSGKFTLRNDIMKRLNAALTKGQIVNIYFTEFIIQ